MSDLVHIKTKYSGDVRRYSYARARLSYSALRKEICRVHCIAPKLASSLELSILKRDGELVSLGKFEKLDLQRYLSSKKRLLNLIVKKVEILKEEEKQSRPIHKFKTGRNNPFLEPHPWPKSTKKIKYPTIITGKEEEKASKHGGWDFLSVKDVNESRAEISDPPDHILRTYVNTITITINGTDRVIKESDIAPDTLLANYLRSIGVTSCKIACGEGGCGACTVTLTSPDPVSGDISTTSTNACMRYLLSCDGMEITTADGVGNVRKGYDPIQTELIDAHGSQCGYCTPGFVMSMFYLVTNRGDDIKMQSIEDSFTGNLCRCTGYLGIYKAFHKFASDGTEDVKRLTAGALETRQALVERASRNLGKAGDPLFFRRGDLLYFKPLEMLDVFTLLDTYSGVPFQLTVGNTSLGVNKYYNFDPNDDPNVIINIGEIPALLEQTVNGDGITVGAAVSISNLQRILRNADDSTGRFAKLADHMENVGTPQMRHTSSWAGNMMIGKTHPAFPSDLLTIFTAAGASIILANVEGDATFSMDEFLIRVMGEGEIIKGLSVPFRDDSFQFGTFKIRARHQNAHPIVNAGFDLRVIADVITQSTIVFGGLQDGPLRARATDNFLVGRLITNPRTLSGALSSLFAETKPTNDGINGAEYRHNLAINLFYKYFLSVVDPSSIPPPLESATIKLDEARPISSSKEEMSSPDPTIEPVSDPVPKQDGLTQAAGEAEFTSDFPVDALFAAPVLSTRAKANIISIDASEALALDGVIDFVSAVDVEAIGGNNEALGLFPGDEEVFASESVITVGQQIGLIITDSNDSSLGEKAAKLVHVEYSDPDPNDPPLLSIDDAVAANSFLESVVVPPTEQGDLDAGFAQADHVIEDVMNQDGQHHFYMETQSALALPDESDSIRIITACQGPSSTVQLLTSVLGMPAKNIIVSTKRAGGAYGGKFTRANPNIAAVAVACRKLNKPVRCQLERLVDFRTTGKRPRYRSNYKVGFNDDGRIVALQQDFLIDGGCTNDITISDADFLQSISDNAYNIPNYRTTARAVRTNLPSNTIMRGPGAVTGVLFTENVVDRVAFETGLDPNVVRETNFYANGDITPFGQPITDSTLDAVWDKVKADANIEQTMADVEAFNKQNRWKKRGVSMTPLKYGLDQGGTRAAALVNIEAVDGTVMVSTSGCDSGQGLYLKVAQAVALRLNVPVDNVRVVETSTQVLPNFSTTGGSSTSEISVQAALNACDTLNENLAPFLTDGATFAEAAKVAQNSVNLSATGYFTPHDEFSFTYFIWGAASCLVEIDILTGEQTIMETNITYDAGVSLNPYVDFGQIEGGFIQGLGLVTTEQVAFNDDGSIKTIGTWDYKPPCSKTIPVKFNVSLLDKSPNAAGILGSKATGEPAVCLGATSVFLAFKAAIQAAREEIGDSNYLPLDTPLTVEFTQNATSTSIDQLVIS